MYAVYAAIACFIAWIWIDYFRLIDVYGNENLQYILYTFFLGAGSVLIVVELHDRDLLKWIPIEPNESMVNNFLYCVFKIGLVEEIAKMIPLLIMYYVFRSQFKEPMDYVAFAAISALGFAAAENTLYFIANNGAVISARAILTSVGHMFYSSLIGYGIVLTKYRDIKP
ncbi:MAG TPA: PrsW family glutamic-type intramembrane protease, partial [Bacteroidia bacterium]|nr:PrsW family glutamic-type intramembrane protease [Bacteroidia bacterium]